MDREAPKLLALLKETLRARGLRYRDVAAALDVSEATVKRYLAGKGLTLTVMDALCRIAGTSISHLADALAQGGSTRPTQLSAEQETGLVHDLSAAFVFYLLRSRWNADDIAAELGLAPAEIYLRLRRLERLGLIDVLPGNRVKVLTARHLDWHPDGPARRAIDRSLRHVFDAMATHNPADAWEIETMKVDDGSIARLHDLISAFSAEVRALAARNRSTPDKDARWYSVLCVAQPVDPSGFLDGTVAEDQNLPEKGAAADPA